MRSGPKKPHDKLRHIQNTRKDKKMEMKRDSGKIEEGN